MVLLLLWRGLRLRCPRCGKTKLFRGFFAMHERCAHCGWVFEREEGYWTGAMALNIVVSGVLLTVVVVPLAARQTPLLPLFAIGLPILVGMMLVFYRYSKSLWMTLDFIVNPVDLW
jgi:uncharacterized protein (DUF983 family)